MQSVVTLVEYTVPKTGVSKKGPWSIHLFKDAGGNKYKTFNDGLSDTARGLMNQPVTVTFDVEHRTYERPDGSTGEASDNVLTSIEAASNAGEYAAPQEQAAPASAPVSAPPVLAQPTPTERPVRSHETNRSDALGHAIAAYGPLKGLEAGPPALFALADVCLSYIETGSHSG